MDTTNQLTGSLARKLAGILKEINHVPKDGHNSHFKYDYVTERALTDALRSKLADAGVFIFTSVDTQVTNGDITEVSTSHTFMDGETGETFTVHGQGQGQDKADKGVYKATTGAMKYFLWKNFLVSVGDDPENDTPANHRTTAAPRANGHANGNGTATRSAPQTGTPPLNTLPSSDHSRAMERADEVLASFASDPYGNGTPPPDDSIAASASAWRSVTVGFGKYKGKTLGDIADADDDGYLEWLERREMKPKDDGTYWASDLALRDGLKAWAAELQAGISATIKRIDDVPPPDDDDAFASVFGETVNRPSAAHR